MRRAALTYRSTAQVTRERLRVEADIHPLRMILDGRRLCLVTRHFVVDAKLTVERASLSRC
jgi:hypothetical protein